VKEKRRRRFGPRWTQEEEGKSRTKEIAITTVRAATAARVAATPAATSPEFNFDL